MRVLGSKDLSMLFGGDLSISLIVVLPPYFWLPILMAISTSSLQKRVNRFGIILRKETTLWLWTTTLMELLLRLLARTI